jgi:multidrug resistance efflux pump
MPGPEDRLAGLRRAREAAEAEWKAQSAELAAEVLAITEPSARAAAYAQLAARLAQTGDALLPEDDERVRASFQGLVGRERRLR